jgi:hypothetical protein
MPRIRPMVLVFLAGCAVLCVTLVGAIFLSASECTRMIGATEPTCRLIQPWATLVPLGLLLGTTLFLGPLASAALRWMSRR